MNDQVVTQLDPAFREPICQLLQSLRAAFDGFPGAGAVLDSLADALRCQDAPPPGTTTTTSSTTTTVTPGDHHHALPLEHLLVVPDADDRTGPDQLDDARPLLLDDDVDHAAVDDDLDHLPADDHPLRSE